jgi:hypothetical protein
LFHSMNPFYIKFLINTTIHNDCTSHSKPKERIAPPPLNHFSCKNPSNPDPPFFQLQ